MLKCPLDMHVVTNLGLTNPLEDQFLSPEAQRRLGDELEVPAVVQQAMGRSACVHRCSGGRRGKGRCLCEDWPHQPDLHYSVDG